MAKTGKPDEYYIVFDASELDDDGPRENLGVFFRVREGQKILDALTESGAFDRFQSESGGSEITDIRVAHLSDVKKMLFSLE